MRIPNGFTTGLILALVVIGTCFGMVACSNTAEQEKAIKATSEIIRLTSVDELYSVNLADGTHCVVLLGYNRGGVSCDSKQNK